MNIIQLTSHKSPTWMQQAKRLHNDGRKEFNMVCSIARMAAQEAAFPRDNSFFALVDNMKSLKNNSFDLNFVIEEIEDIYNEAYSISNQADVIPFPISVQGGGK